MCHRQRSEADCVRKGGRAPFPNIIFIFSVCDASFVAPGAPLGHLFGSLGWLWKHPPLKKVSRSQIRKNLETNLEKSGKSKTSGQIRKNLETKLKKNGKTYRKKQKTSRKNKNKTEKLAGRKTGQFLKLGPFCGLQFFLFFLFFSARKLLSVTTMDSTLTYKALNGIIRPSEGPYKALKGLIRTLRAL